jgi:Replication-relaxation
MTTPGPKFTDRDYEIIKSIHDYRYMTERQIERLYFPSVQSANRRLKVLVNFGYLEKFCVHHMKGYIYYLSADGLALLAHYHNQTAREFSRNRTEMCLPRESLYLCHFLAINDFRVSLSLDVRQLDTQLVNFIPEFQTDETSNNGFKHIRDKVVDCHDKNVTLSHTPDGVFALSKDNHQRLFFLEMDLGKESIGDKEKGLLRHIRFYLNYLHHGKYQRYQADFNYPQKFQGFRALIVTTVPARVEHIRDNIKLLQFEEKYQRFILLTDLRTLGHHNLSTAVWRSGDINDNSWRFITGDISDPPTGIR